MEGLMQGYFVDAERGSCLTWNIDNYDFDEVVSILGIETSFPKKINRIIEFEIIEPLIKPIKESGDYFELVIHGGGWK